MVQWFFSVHGESGGHRWMRNVQNRNHGGNLNLTVDIGTAILSILLYFEEDGRKLRHVRVFKKKQKGNIDVQRFVIAVREVSEREGEAEEGLRRGPCPLLLCRVFVPWFAGKSAIA